VPAGEIDTVGASFGAKEASSRTGGTAVRESRRLVGAETALDETFRGGTLCHRLANLAGFMTAR